MTHIVEGRPPFAPPPPTTSGWAIHWVCTNNPFYAISAGLFLAGLWTSFPDPSQAEDTWGLLAGLFGYTLLLAATAYLLVRFANVWDDARTVLLLVVLMFLATSATFDRMLVDQVVGAVQGRGIVCFLLGLYVAILVSEGLLRGMGLALSILYRVPYYLILSLFFLYPVVLAQLVDLRDAHSEAVFWGLYGFSSLAGLVFLTLLPAIRRGARYVRANGSPWPWPLYPWSLFALLALAVPGRAILLCFSMHLIDIRDLWESVFGLYFLVPFGLAIAVLVLEIGLAAPRRTEFFHIALIVPAALVVLTLVSHRADRIYDEGVTMFTARLGAGPAYMALLGATLFYGYAALRRAPNALEAMTAALLILAVCGSRAHQMEGFYPWQQIPLFVGAVVQLGVGIWRRDAHACLIGCLIGVASLIRPADAASLRLRIIVASQLASLTMLVLGAIFEDDLGRKLRHYGTGFALLACLIASFVPLRLPPGVPPSVATVYPLAMAAMLAGYGIWQRHPTLVVSGVIFVAWAISSGWQAYVWCRHRFAGLDFLTVSFVLFILALGISLGKAGLLSRWFARDKAMQTSID